MKEYTFDEIEVGMSESFEVKITEEMHNSFTKISGDINPMHIDDEYARENGFDGRLVYGMLTASLYSKLVGVYLPGRYCLFYECDSLFNKPVYINDVLLVQGKVVEKEDVPARRIVIKGTIKKLDVNKTSVSMARLVVGVTK